MYIFFSFLQPGNLANKEQPQVARFLHPKAAPGALPAAVLLGSSKPLPALVVLEAAASFTYTRGGYTV